MPIIFQQPSPLRPDISIGYGAAETAMKALPTLAALYEHIASMRGGGGGGGSGHGGGSSSFSPGAGGVGGFDSGYDPASEQQANRDQRTQEMMFNARVDPVAGHIQQQQDFKLQQQGQSQQLQQDRLDQLNKEGKYAPQKAATPPQWGPQDAEDLVNQQQIVAKTTQAFKAGTIPGEVASIFTGNAQDQINLLTQKQQAAAEAAKQQQYKQAVDGAAHQDGLTALRTKNLNEWMPIEPDDIPGMPKKHYTFDDKGVPKVDNEKERLQHQKAFHDQRMEGMKEAAKAKDSEVKQSEAEEKHYGEDRKLAVDELLKTKGKDKAGTQITPSEDEIHSLAMNFGQRRIEAREQRGLEKNANPQIRAAYLDHVDSFPKADGKPDWNQGSNGQLAQLGKFLADPKAVGVTKNDATEGIAKIRKILEERAKPVTPPPETRPAPNETRAFAPLAKTFPKEAEQDPENPSHYNLNAPQVKSIDWSKVKSFLGDAGDFLMRKHGSLLE